MTDIDLFFYQRQRKRNKSADGLLQNMSRAISGGNDWGSGNRDNLYHKLNS
jgi:hypothetical protein